MKAVRASRVRFSNAVPDGTPRGMTHEWTASRFIELVVFPEIGQARCVPRDKEGNPDRPIVARYDYYIAESLEEQLDFEGDSVALKCEICGQTFENSQGLGKHRVTKHPEVSGK